MILRCCDCAYWIGKTMRCIKKPNYWTLNFAIFAECGDGQLKEELLSQFASIYFHIEYDLLLKAITLQLNKILEKQLSE